MMPPPEDVRPELAQKRERQAVARQIADELGEQGPPRQQIGRIVVVIGPERALTLLAEAQAIQLQDGESTVRGQKRTLGGIFFRLVRQLSAENEQVRAIFLVHPSRRKATTGKAAETRAPAGAPPRWEDRLEALDTLIAAAGEAKTMKVTLIGRLGKVIDKGTYVMTAMPAQKLPTLPKGLPPLLDGAVPPQTLVLIARKQWSRVEAALADPDDLCIIEGVAVYDEAVHGLAVLATNVTTNSMQRAKRPPTTPTIPEG